jgi:hypothetical protein
MAVDNPMSNDGIGNARSMANLFIVTITHKIGKNTIDENAGDLPNLFK